ncbi:unnamed protein product, partial [Coregonus sp. 'balchen']
MEEPVKQKESGEGVYDYYPHTPGKYTVTITWGGQHIPKSPFEVGVGPEAGPQKIRAWGPGLEGGMVGKSADFVAESIGTDVGVLGFAIEGPSQAKIECEDQNDGSCDVKYWPSEAGEYAVHVMCDDEDIEDSPFMAYVVKAYGPGLEKSGCVINKPAEFTVNAKDAGTGPLKISAQSAEGGPLDVKVKKTGDGVYVCSYTPITAVKHTVAITWAGVSVPNSPFRVRPPQYNVPDQNEEDVDFDIIPNANDTITVKYIPPGAGRLTIKVLFTDQEIPVSPFRVKVEPSHDASKVKAEGPGVAPLGVECGKPTHFTVHTKGAGKAPVDVQFTGTGKGDAVQDFDIIDNYDYSHTVKYTPIQQVIMTTHTPSSMLQYNSKVQVNNLDGRVEVGQDQEFVVGTKGAGGQGKLEVRISSPSGKLVPCVLEAQPGKRPENSRVKYIPKEEGLYAVEVIYDGQPIPGSPFPVEATLPPDPSKVKAFGPGLKGGLVGNPAEFTIDTKGAGTGGLGLTVEGPTEAKIECSDNGDGTCSVSYLPTEPGEYLVNILFEETHIPGSPFHADVHYPFDPTKRAKVGETSVVNVDCSRAGPGQLTLDAASDSGNNKAKTEVIDNKDGTYTVTYVPLTAGMYTLLLKYGGTATPGFPAKVMVDPAVDTSRVQATTDFTVDARSLTKKGGDHIKAQVRNPSGALTDCVVLYDESPVPKSPFQVGVEEGCDPTRVLAKGPGLQEALTEAPNNFSIITRGAGIGGLGITVEGPSESKMSCKDNKDGSCNVEYIPFVPGLYDVNITYGGKHIPGSPFKVPVKDMVDPSKVKISGPGVGSGVRAKIPQSFTVDCSKAGVAPLSVAVTAPKGVAEPVEITDNGDGTHTVAYTPSVEGPYSVVVKYADEELPRSPFKLRVLPTHDASKVRASGPGLTTGVPASLPVEFTIDAKDAGEGQLSVQITDQDGKPKRVGIHDNGDGTYLVSYVPDKVGRYTIVIKYGGDEIPASPYRVRATSSGDASKCTVTGPGIAPVIAVGQEVGFVVNAKAAGKGKVTCIVVTPDGTEVEADVIQNEDGTFDIFYTAPTPGNYVIYVRFGGENVPKSPFRVMATDEAPMMQQQSANQQSAAPGAAGFQPWVTDGSYHPANRMNGTGFRPFDMVIPFAFRKGEITGGLDLAIEGPSKAEICCQDNKDGTCTVTYLPVLPGDYQI